MSQAHINLLIISTQNLYILLLKKNHVFIYFKIFFKAIVILHPAN